MTAQISVPTIALDDYFDVSDKVTLLKIDVEGAEFGVFKGAERTLRQHAPLLVFECENRHLAPGYVQDAWRNSQGQSQEMGGDRVVPITCPARSTWASLDFG